VPSTSISPEISRFAKTEVPVEVIAPQPIVPIVAIFLLPSRTTALLAAAAPAVTESRTPISAVVIVVVSSV